MLGVIRLIRCLILENDEWCRASAIVFIFIMLGKVVGHRIGPNNALWELRQVPFVVVIAMIFPDRVHRTVPRLMESVEFEQSTPMTLVLRLIV